MMRIGKLVTIAACSFIVGRLISVSISLIDTTESIRSNQTTLMLEDDDGLGPILRKPKFDVLEQQIHDRLFFQKLLNQSQHPMDCISSRYLILDKIMIPKDGFASEFQYVSRLLQSSLSSRRVLFIQKEWNSAYCPDGHRPGGNAGWTCLWKPITNCTNLPPKGVRPNISNLESILNPLIYGIEKPQQQKKQQRSSSSSSYFFDPYAYGPQRKFIDAPISFPLKRTSPIIDVISHWERVYGRFWIRSQVSHYLWKPNNHLEAEINKKLEAFSSSGLLNAGVASIPAAACFVGMHIRFTDNIPDFEKSFGRNATYTRQVERYLAIAEQIRREYHHSHINTIYVATDHEYVLDWAKELSRGRWTIIGQSNIDVQRSTTQTRVWFAKSRSQAAVAMATDLELLRRADFLIGSFQSNVYRLATQLNTAYNVHKYSLYGPNRYYSVDIEWYEDP